MRLATWNVNSARARHFRLVDWLDRAAPDVACLQETKMGDEEFDALYSDDLFRRGYTVAHFGQGRWNGVALLSRVGLDDVVKGLPEAAGPLAGEARAIGATCGELRVWSLYVPNGRSLDDPMFPAKLTWLGGLRQVLAGELAQPRPVVVAGDFNIAPADNDVWDAAAFQGSTHVTDDERQVLADLEADGLHDLVRTRWPDQVAYSYWDYRAGMFHKNLGMRIDLVLGTEPLRGRLAAAYVDRQARKGKDPSDHAPVIVDLDEAPDGDIGPLVPPPSAQPVRRSRA
ncbi:MAG TPA: exodeoxyribonuclease III [Frankiaceae bacterium]|nr:exodeoxyribonuclease III [Frankiaceae bacterium]